MELYFGIGGFVLFVLLGLRVAQEYERAVVFRLGRFAGVRGPGLYWNLPFFEWQQKIDIRTVTCDIEPQETITKDSVTIRVNAVLWYRVSDPEKAIIAVEAYRRATQQVALTTLRNIIGQHDLDEVLRSRDSINRQIKGIVDRLTDPWGIIVEMVEMKDVEIPEVMQRAMAREAEAVREKRARIIKAEAEKESSEQLAQAARFIAAHPAALELRRLQTIAEVGAEHNSTTLLVMPSDFLYAASAFAQQYGAGSSKKPPES